MSDLDKRLSLLFSRGVVRQADVADGLANVQAEFLKGEFRRVELPQGYGLASKIKAGSEVFAAFANGERSAGVALAHDDRRARPEGIKDGEVVLYGAGAKEPIGHSIWFTDEPKPNTIRVRGRRLELRAGDHYIVIDADDGISSSG